VFITPSSVKYCGILTIFTLSPTFITLEVGTEMQNRRSLSLRCCSVLLGRSLPNKPSNNMAFPHPKSRQDHYRNKHIPCSRRVVWNLVKRTIDVTNDRNGKDDVNPAKNRTLNALSHRSPRLTTFEAP
jgi:hypothetical protein